MPSPVSVGRDRARVARNVRVADMNIDVPVSDARCIEVVAHGPPLWHGAQLALDATIVSPVTRAGEPQPGADTRPGAAVHAAARRKRRQNYPELASARRARLVVIGVEVGGRFGAEAASFLRHLARHRAASLPPPLRGLLRARDGSNAGPASSLSPPCAPSRRRCSSCRRVECGSGARPDPRGPRQRPRRRPARKPPACALPVGRCTRALGPRSTGEKGARKKKKTRPSKEPLQARTSAWENKLCHLDLDVQNFVHAPSLRLLGCGLTALLGGLTTSICSCLLTSMKTIMLAVIIVFCIRAKEMQ